MSPNSRYTKSNELFFFFKGGRERGRGREKEGRKEGGEGGRDGEKVRIGHVL